MPTYGDRAALAGVSAPGPWDKFRAPAAPPLPASPTTVDEWALFRTSPAAAPVANQAGAPIEAELADGRILEFPAGTSPDVIQRVAKQQTAGSRSAGSGPWDKYASPSASAVPAAAGPWTRYAPNGAVAAAPTAGEEWAAFRTAPATAEPEPPAPAEPTEVYRGAILPWKKMSDGTTPFAVPSIISGVIDSLRLPEKVASGKIDPMSDEAFEQQLGLAGLVVGGGMPKVGGALMNGAGKFVPDAVSTALRADGVPLAEAAARVRELGPAGVVADLGPNARYKAAALATRPGPAQTIVVDAMRARQRAAPTRLTGALDETLGPAPVPSYVDREIGNNMRALGPEYDRALATAAPVDTSALAGQLDGSIENLRGAAQTKTREVRGMLNDVADPELLDTSPAVLHQTRQAIDGMLDGEQDGNVRRVLGAARAQLDQILGDAVPGLKAIDSRYAELGGQRRAVERGQTVLDNGRTAPRPAELADEVAAGTVAGGEVVGPSGVAFRLSQGARAEIDRLVGTKLNDRAALNGLLKGESDWNRQRLDTLFGPEKVDKLYRVLDNERAMAETENMALANSKTAGVQAAQREIDGPQTGQKGPIRSAFNFNFGDAAAGAADKLTGGYSTYRRDTINQDIADALMGTGDLSVTSRTGASKSGVTIGALLDAIFSSGAPAAPAAAKRPPISDEEYRQAVLQGLGA